VRVIGIDCGTERTGYGVIDSDGTVHRVVASGVVRTSAKDSLATRLCTIAGELREVLRQYQPDAVAVEEVFQSVNAKSALKLAHVRGVALLTVAEAGLVLGEYSPMEVKMSVAGYGRAEKHQIQLMVTTLLNLAATPAEDASDALAVAICHATRSAFSRRMEAAR
jgi:crossover junction endodeoxyribonuclease RuvC